MATKLPKYLQDIDQKIDHRLKLTDNSRRIAILAIGFLLILTTLILIQITVPIDHSLFSSVSPRNANKTPDILSVEASTTPQAKIALREGETQSRYEYSPNNNFWWRDYMYHPANQDHYDYDYNRDYAYSPSWLRQYPSWEEMDGMWGPNSRYSHYNTPNFWYDDFGNTYKYYDGCWKGDCGVDRTVYCGAELKNIDPDYDGMFTITFDFYNDYGNRIDSKRVAHDVLSGQTELFETSISSNAPSDITCDYKVVRAPYEYSVRAVSD